MSSQENEVSWQVLRRIVHDWAGTTAELAEVAPLAGGCINTTLALTTKDNQRAVLKITPHRVDRHYEEEAYQLNVMRELGLPVPDVYACKVGTLDDPHSYILLQFMPGVDLSEARRQSSPEQFDHLQMHLAELVLTMHGHTNPHFRRVTPDGAAADTYDHWPRFFRDIYDPILREAEKSEKLPKASRKCIHKVHEKLDRLLGPHGDKPRLVHWDIWATNLLARPDEHGRWWITAILDPNCKFAHAEAEIAYMDLFKTITPAFLRAYQQSHRLTDDYHRIRKPVYQLYPLIDHVHLFGHHYDKPLLEVVEKLSAVV